jgi:hypothetical protein
VILPLGTFANPFLFEDKVGPWALRLPATIVSARENRWRGSMNAIVSEKVFDVSFVDDCSAGSQLPGEVPSRGKANPFRDIGMGIYSLIEAKHD